MCDSSIIMMFSKCCFYALLLCSVSGQFGPRRIRKLPDEIKHNVWSHKDDVDRIVNYLLNGDGKGTTYSRLAEYTDKFGPRITGSQVLEDSIDYLMEELQKEGFENVAGEPMMVDIWERRNEQLTLLQPRMIQLDILALGTSVGTPPEGITANAVVVTSFDELETLSNEEVQGRIVVFNQQYDTYFTSVQYRSSAATEAAKKGAVAALVKSITGYSLYTPHTGMQYYDESVTKIPAASATMEDAEMLHRMYIRGDTIQLHLNMTSHNNGQRESRNVVAEIVGKEKHDEIVLFGGHVDSWDVGVGAMDDAGGCMISWQVLSTLKALSLHPKRTMRLVMWTAEEQGALGGNEYYRRHKEESNRTVLTMESDYGIFKTYGIGFKGSGLAHAIMEEIMEMIAGTGLGGVTEIDWAGGADIARYMEDGVPSGNLWNDNRDYFNYHHSKADTMKTMTPEDLDRASLIWTVATYVVANLEEPLPRNGDYPYTEVLDGYGYYSAGNCVTPKTIVWLGFLVYILKIVL